MGIFYFQDFGMKLTLIFLCIVTKPQFGPYHESSDLISIQAIRF